MSKLVTAVVALAAVGITFPARGSVAGADSLGSVPTPAFAGLTSVLNPSGNVAPPYPFNPGPQCTSGAPGAIDNSVVCTEAALADINYARGLEGVAPMGLPANWYSLSVPEQLLVVENYERTSRGLPPFAGLANALDSASETGAAAETDPEVPPVGVLLGGAIFGAEFPNVLAVDYIWMYYDGYGGPNIACTAPGSPGCWGHREIILANDPSGLCPTCQWVAGAGFATPGGVTSFTGISALVQGSLVLDWAWNPAAETPAVNGFIASTGMAATPDGGGYWIVDSTGGVTAHGDALDYGSMAGRPLNAPISHIVSTPDGRGYWLVAADGGTFAFGDAGYFGSMGGRTLNAPVVDIAPTADGRGYWLVAADGGIFAFGDAIFHGSMGGQALNAPVVGIAPDQATGGYWEVASDGGIFAFGAPFYGSTGNLALDQPVNGITPTPDDRGYWFVASDGGLFAFGDASFHGSMGGQALNAPVVGMAADPATGGYWLLGADGGLFAFGAPFLGG